MKLSSKALEIFKAAYNFYQNDKTSGDCKSFYGLKQFNLPEEELNSLCEEIQDAGLVFFERDADGVPYLYMLFPGVQFGEKHL
ncbi:hypothetical protein [Anaerotignum propionicum]|uniref:hypothetical protein n=1 Tax=Anaerotignum propionicum TaxID=28446 RepID=UPI00210927AF|nr:hypothetical protein [Anaerotignum propionicum]MCQ4936741.1 hypothetical protein [Anaerotignum propionicum]